jgi:RNA-directed DNA polymerase
MTRVLNLNHTDARQYFLKEESYFNFDLPQYFTFQNLINVVSTRLTGSRLQDFHGTRTVGEQTKPTYPKDFEDVNYRFLNNKDGKFAWRPFQLIHPAIYVSLVHNITEETNWNLIKQKFIEFGNNAKISCQSIPIRSDEADTDKAATITQWWQAIEQKSIELALQYEYVLHTDITDCYGSIYTHTIPWALHTKATAKASRQENGLIGNVIDAHLRSMAFGQTNGIPQGSALMDFIAEMVLGYADLELSTKIQANQIEDYQIVRYRDDYRIFTNNPQTADLITKLLTEILIELGMRLNAQKTIVSNNVIRDSIKPDKIFWLESKRGTRNIQEHLLLIHGLSENHPNSGSLTKALNKYFDRIKRITETKQNIKVLVSILVDIMFKNPRTYPISAAILSKFLSLLPEIEEKQEIVNKILRRFDKIPNTGHVKIWLQRVTIKIEREKIYTEKLCQKVNDQAIQIWNSDWLNGTLKNLVESTSIINEDLINDLDDVIESDEVQLFKSDYEYDEPSPE